MVIDFAFFFCLPCTESYLPQRFWREGWIF